MLEQALRCHALGFSVIPVGKEKKPLIAWKQYQNQRATPQQIRAWFKEFPDMNIGAVTGAISGIVVIDVDKGGSTEGLPATVTVQTGGGGWHLYYKHPEQVIGTNARKIAPLTDIRGDGGYVVLPPSVHASGNAYQWSMQPEDGFSDMTPELLARLTAKTSNDTVDTKVGDIEEGSRNDAATRYIGRILHYLPADLWDAAGWASLKDWNSTRAKPPLSENELRNVFSSIKEKEGSHGSTTSSSDPGRMNFTPFTLTTLYKEAFPDARWVVNDLIPFGTITALTGESNSYKTFFTQSMAASVSAGTSFLGHFPTTKGKVLIIDEENHRRHVKERYESLGITATPNILFLSQEGMRVDNEKHIENLRELLDREKPALVILDSLVRLHSGEENSATEIAKAFSGMRRLVSNDRAIIVIHHHRKPQGFGKKTGSQSIRGSSDILAAVDSHLAIDRKETEITVTQTKMRLQPELKPFKAALVPTPEGPLSFAYQGEDTSENDRIQEAYDEIKAALAESIEPLTIDMIAKGTSLPLARVRQAVKDLILSNEVVITSIGAHGIHFHGLPTSNTPQSTTITK